MEKIVIAIDSSNMDVNAVSFACYLARITHSRLTGIFLQDLVLEEDVVISESEGVPFIESIAIREVPDEENKLKIRRQNMRLFKSITDEEAVEADVHLDKGLPAGDMIAKSRFADVLVIDPSTSFSKVYEVSPTHFVKELLHDAECPVIISPVTFNGIDNIVFCYDGSKSSVFAIKQFSYLFPELKNKRAKVIYMGTSDDEETEDELALIDYLKYHYADVEFVPLEGDATEAFFSYLLKKKNDFVVMGAYGKGLLASFFENNVPGTDLRTTTLPVFVAHY